MLPNLSAHLALKAPLKERYVYRTETPCGGTSITASGSDSATESEKDKRFWAKIGCASACVGSGVSVATAITSLVAGSIPSGALGLVGSSVAAAGCLACIKGLGKEKLKETIKWYDSTTSTYGTSLPPYGITTIPTQVTDYDLGYGYGVGGQIGL